MTCGGYRPGAGRPGHRPKAEDCWRLRIGTLARGGALRDGASMAHRWLNVDGSAAASINVHCSGGALSLSWREGGKPARQRVELDAVLYPQGGRRPLFRCPRCGSRAVVLTLHDGEFACSPCHDLAFESQSQEPITRAVVRVEAVRARLQRKLGAELTRPPGMRRSFYAKLMEPLEAAELRLSELLAARVAG